MPLKIHTNLKYLTGNVMPITMLDPLWPGHSFENETLYNLQGNRLNRYQKVFYEIFEIVDIESADFAVFPIAWELSRSEEGTRKLGEMREIALKHNKKLIVFVGGDLQPKLPFDDLIVFHTSLISSLRKKNEFGMPALIEDLIEHHYENNFIIRDWVAKPSIAFCGTALPLSMPLGFKKIKEGGRFLLYKWGFLKLRPQSVGYAPRVRAILKLQKSSKVTGNIIIRSSSPMIWAYGFLLNKGNCNTEALRSEYLENIKSSDYVLCVRGNGNYSIRLYEALCMGRIPVIVNTGVVLPFEGHLPWKDFCVWVEEKEIDKIDEKILAFHNKFRGKSFSLLQKSCRNFWINWLSAEGFFLNFHTQIS